MKCDVLVVGASPAGLMAASSSARAGLNAVLVDRNLDRLTHPANTMFEGMASRAGIKIEDCYIKNRLSGMRIISPAGHFVTIPAKGYFLDREKFNRFYLKAAERLGVELFKAEASGTGLKGDRRTVATDQGEIEAGVVIDASGIEPALAHKAGLSPMRHPNDIAWAVEALVQHPGIGDEDYFQYWIGSMAPGWKATFSPAGGDLASIGVFVRGHGRDVQGFFDRFIRLFKSYKSADYRDIGDLRVLSVFKGGDPIAVVPGEIVSNGFMVTGGAAGQSGLAYSMMAGTICGEVAASALSSGDVSIKALTRYEKLWKSEFSYEYRMGRASLLTLSEMKDEEIDGVVKGMSGRELLSGGSFFKKAVCAGATLTSVSPRSALSLIRNLMRG